MLQTILNLHIPFPAYVAMLVFFGIMCALFFYAPELDNEFAAFIVYMSPMLITGICCLVYYITKSNYALAGVLLSFFLMVIESIILAIPEM